MIFFSKDLSLVPETSAPKEHFKLVFGFGTSDSAKIRPLKVGPPAINWKSSLFCHFFEHELPSVVDGQEEKPFFTKSLNFERGFTHSRRGWGHHGDTDVL